MEDENDNGIERTKRLIAEAEPLKLNEGVENENES